MSSRVRPSVLGVSVGLLTAVVVAGCNAGPPEGGTAAEERRAAGPSGPVGLVALGHSGITGEGATQDRSEWGRYSWATGEAAEVASIYSRMIGLHPETEGHVANTAVGGASSSALEAQARAALDQVATPRLVLIQTIDNDIRCDDGNAAHVPAFGENLAAALDVLTTKSPDSTILVVDQRGRPTLLAEHLPDGPPAEGDPAADPCRFIDTQGRHIAEKAQALTAIIEAYEDEQSRVCAQYERCHDDGNVLREFDDFADGMVSADGNHLASAGQARLAELIWPVVEKILAESD